MVLALFARKTEYGKRGVAAADLRSNQVVYAHNSGDDRNVLLTAGAVGDYATAGGASQSLSQEYLAGPCIQREEVASDFARKHQVACGRCDTGYHRFRRVVAPFLLACGGIECRETTPGRGPRIELRLAAEVEAARVFFLRIRGRRIFAELRTPVGGGDNQHVLCGVVRRAVPLLPTESTRAHPYGCLDRRFDVQPGDEWNAVNDFFVITVQQTQQSVFSGTGDHVAHRPVDSGLEYGRHVRDIVIVDIVGYELAVPRETTRRGIQGNQRIRIEIIAGAIVIVEIGGGVPTRHVKQILFLVKRHGRPEIAATVFACVWIRP